MSSHWLIGAILLTISGCGAGAGRPEPPSGAVDPGVSGLVTAGGASLPLELPPPGAVNAGAIGGPPLRPAASGEGRVAEATGKIVMTREHCETLGRKFAELAVEQNGGLGAFSDRSALEREGGIVGRTFAEKCSRDLAGQTVEAGEYQCMLRARAAEELTSCKK